MAGPFIPFIRKLNLNALFAGFAAIFIAFAISGEILLRFYSQPLQPWFDIVWTIRAGFPFFLGGYLTAWIAKDAPSLNSVFLATTFPLITIYTVLSGMNSDPIPDLAVAALAKFVLCSLGGVARIWLASRQRIKIGSELEGRKG